MQRYADYSDMMQMLVKQWRMDWNDWNLPFLFVQLPMYLADGEKDDSCWALQREQQYIASMMIQNTGMISLADCVNMTIFIRWIKKHRENVCFSSRKIWYTTDRERSQQQQHSCFQTMGSYM